MYQSIAPPAIDTLNQDKKSTELEFLVSISPAHDRRRMEVGTGSHFQVNALELGQITLYILMIAAFPAVA